MNWKLAIMRVFVNGLAVGLTATIVPGITMVARGWAGTLLDLLIVGAVLGLLNAFLRPAVQYVALPLLFPTYGLVIILVDSLMLYVLSLVLPRVISVDHWLSAVLGGVLAYLLIAILEGLLGMTPPLIDTAPPLEEELPIQRRLDAEDQESAG